MNMYVQHFLAWLRGDLTKIVSAFDKAIKKLEAHEKYRAGIAENQAHLSRDLAYRSKLNYQEADKAKAVRANLTKLVTPDA